MNGSSQTKAMTRPHLKEGQAALYSRDHVLANDGPILLDAALDPINQLLADRKPDSAPDYRVSSSASESGQGAKCFPTIAKALDQAIQDVKDGKAKNRISIGIEPGLYNELVIVPALEVAGKNVPVTLMGLHEDARKTCIRVNIDQGMSGHDYRKAFGSSFEGLDPAITNLFEEIALRADNDIGTAKSAVMRICNHGFEARNLTIENAYNEDRITSDITNRDKEAIQPNAKGQLPKGQHQAVAILIDGADRVLFENVHMLGDQDTLYFKSDDFTQTIKAFFRSCYIEGDVDFIFGNSTAFFEKCEIRSLGQRGSGSYVAAPSTNLRIPYGIVFSDCDFTHDGSAQAKRGLFSLGRQWFERVRCTPYGKAPIPDYRCRFGDWSEYKGPEGIICPRTLEAVGKIAILNSRIGAHINHKAPWAEWNGGWHDKEGHFHSAEWNLRYRPVQFSMADFLRYLEPWLKAEGLDYGDVDDTLPFIGEFGNVDIPDE